MRHGHAERLRYMEVNMPYTQLERIPACPVFCSRGHPATDTGLRLSFSEHSGVLLAQMSIFVTIFAE